MGNALIVPESLKSASELCSIKVKRCPDPGSNRGPLDLQSNALPTELSRQVVLELLRVSKQITHFYKRIEEFTRIINSPFRLRYSSLFWVFCDVVKGKIVVDCRSFIPYIALTSDDSAITTIPTNHVLFWGCIGLYLDTSCRRTCNLN